MPTVVPAIRAKMGKIEYYQTTMKASELVKSVRAAQDTDEWANLGPEERMQRVLDGKRVMHEIAPYLARFEDRFFGSFIVLIYGGSVEWEPLTQFGTKIPAAYKSQGERMGFVTIDGGELIVLDGQHRNAALEKVIKRADGLEGPYAADVPNDDLSVIFLPNLGPETTRRIFNKVNRHAKPTSRGDNIITSEDDGYAILARRLFTEPDAPFYPAAALVEWKNNALTDGSAKLTTINVLHETAKAILLMRKPAIDWMADKAQQRPDEDELEEAQAYLFDFWEDLISGVTTYAEGRKDPSAIAPARKPSATTSLLHKPAAQIAMIQGLVKAVQRGAKRSTCIARLNQINWSMDPKGIWGAVLVAPNGRIITRKENVRLASELVAYLVAPEVLNDQQEAALHAAYNDMKGSEPDALLPLPEPMT